MTLKPCIVCGTPANGSRCPEHQPKDTRTNRDHVAWHNNGRWKAMSKRLRRASPFCEWCGDVNALSVDHVLPVSQFPELTYAVENCRVLCKVCNGKRGNKFTHDEANAVLIRLQDSQTRRPTKSGHERVEAAQRAALTWGHTPNDEPDRPGGSRNPRYTPLGVSAEKAVGRTCGR